MKNKIGLVTCYIDNYGACLQAFALQSFLRQYGYGVEIIRYDYRVKISDRRFGLVDIVLKKFDMVKKHSKHYEIKKKIGLMKRHNRFASFRKKYLLFSKPILSFDELKFCDLKYNFYVCGSDQIWNPTLSKSRDIRFDMLSFTKEYKIAYAPSIGISAIPEDYIKPMKEYISDFNYVSCRESTGCDLISDQLGFKKSQLVLDPTFLLNKNEWCSKFKIRKKQKRYILCYFFNDSDLVFESINKFKELLNVDDVYIIPFTAKAFISEYRIIYSPSVSEFVSLINNAELVLTDSFHGTAFSINLNTNFFVFNRFEKNDPNSMNSRIYSVLKLFNLQDRLIVNSDDLLEAVHKISIDFSDTNLALDELRKSSAMFLDEAIKNAN